MNMDYNANCFLEQKGCNCSGDCQNWPATPTGTQTNCLPLATAYVRPQCYTQISNPMQALCQGTVFPELVSPYR